MATEQELKTASDAIEAVEDENTKTALKALFAIHADHTAIVNSITEVTSLAREEVATEDAVISPSEPSTSGLDDA